MYAVQPEEPLQMTEAQYLEFEATNDLKHEYRQGNVYAMTGASVRHNTITMNIGTQLNIQLAERDCVVTSADTRVHIVSKSAYRYPDVTVFCGDPSYLAGRTDTITNPVVLVEVLSPSTALTDRNEKLVEYIQIESLHAYLLVAQDEARIERFMRHETGEWLYSLYTGWDDEVHLPAIHCKLTLAKVYQKVAFDRSASDMGE